MRKSLLDYDNIVSEQRKIIYERRNEILDTDDITTITYEGLKVPKRAIHEDTVTKTVTDKSGKSIAEMLAEMGINIKQVAVELNEEIAGQVQEDLDDGDQILLDPKQIYYLDHVERKLFAYTRDGVYRIMDTLSSCEEMLWNYGFVRVSKSNLINIYKITQLKPDLNMKVYASFDNGERICVNRSYKKEFDEYLQRIRRMQ